MTKKEKFYTDNQDNLVCPHCGYEHDYQGESEPYFECHNCEKEFAYQIESQPIFTSQTLEEYLKNKIINERSRLTTLNDLGDELKKIYQKEIKECEASISELQEKLNKLNEE